MVKQETGKPPEKERRKYKGELLLDNQDLCFMLKMSKRTLQRYSSLGWLPYNGFYFLKRL